MSETLTLRVCPKYRKHDATERAAEAAYAAAKADEQLADEQLTHWQERAANVELAVREGLESAHVHAELEKAKATAREAAATSVKAKLALEDARSARLGCIVAAEEQVAVIARKRLADIRSRQEGAREALARANADEVALYDEMSGAIYGANGGARGPRFYLGNIAEGIR